jgi:hypothetical protein
MPEKDELDLLLDSALATYADPGPDSGLEQRVLAGLEAARKSGESPRAFAGTRRWLPWAIALPLAASLLLWIAMEQFRHSPLVQQQHASQHRPSDGTNLANGDSKGHDVSRTASGGDSKGHDVSRTASRGDLKGHDVSRTASGGDLKGHDFSRAATARKSRRALAPEGRLSATAQLEHPVPLPKLAIFPSPQPLTAEEQALVLAATRGSKAEREALLEPPPSLDTPLNIAALNIPPLAAPGEGKN